MDGSGKPTESVDFDGIPLFYWHAEGVNTFWSLATLFAFPAVVGGAGLIAFTRPNKHPEPHPM
jgi:hypothetical protein